MDRTLEPSLGNNQSCHPSFGLVETTLRNCGITLALPARQQPRARSSGRRVILLIICFRVYSARAHTYCIVRCAPFTQPSHTRRPHPGPDCHAFAMEIAFVWAATSFLGPIPRYGNCGARDLLRRHLASVLTNFHRHGIKSSRSQG